MEEAPEALTVLYDDTCGLCRRLAEYGRARSDGALDFVSWQTYAKQTEAATHFSEEERAAPPRHLRALHHDRVLEDADAWAAILMAYPPFESFSWIAERLGFMGTVSRATFHGAQWLRGQCGTCD